MKSGEISIMASKVGDCQNQSQNMWWNPAGTMFINFNSAAGQMEKSHWENNWKPSHKNNERWLATIEKLPKPKVAWPKHIKNLTINHIKINSDFEWEVSLVVGSYLTLALCQAVLGKKFHPTHLVDVLGESFHSTIRVCIHYRINV